MSSQFRRALAATLGGVARGLSASARMFEQASWILRPREPAAADVEGAAETVGGPGTGVEAPGPVGGTEPADVMEPDATDVMEPGGADVAAPETPPAPAEAPGAGPVEEEPVEPSVAEEPPVTEAEPAAEPTPTVSAPEGPDRMKAAESHIAALAERPVADVVSEIAGMSTDELEDLYAHEVTHKNRKTVLRAIERAVAPSSDSS